MLIADLKGIWSNRPAYKSELLDYLRKVNQLADEVDKTHFGGDIDRKEQIFSNKKKNNIM